MLQMYIHTRKAVKRGEPADRLFLVSYTGHSELVAWKCIITAGGIIHPAYKRPLKLAELEKAASLRRGRNGSQPTATFKPDSLYQSVGIAEVAELVKVMKTANGGKTRAKAKVTGSILPKMVDYTGSNMDWINFSARIEVQYGKLSANQRAEAENAWSKFMDELRKI